MPKKAAEHWDARIGRRIRLRDLHVLLTVVQCGSMAKAARGLGVTQPAVSKAIAELENILGVRLLDRGPQGVEATLYGSALVRRGLTVFDELRQGVGEIAFMADPAVGHVRIGCNESLTAAMLPAVISRLSDQYPGVTLDVAQMSRPITVEIRELRERNVDLIIGRGVFPIPEDDLNAEILFEEPLVVVTGAQSPWARRRKIDLAELVDEKWILFAPHEAPGALLAESFRARGLRAPRTNVTTSSFHLRDALLMTGDYLTVVPSCMVRVFNAKHLTVKCLPIDLPVQQRPVAIFTLKNRTLSPVAELFIKCVRAVAKPLGQERRQGTTTHGGLGIIHGRDRTAHSG
jgi:DNA-binding transcriptional LysR family regulator